MTGWPLRELFDRHAPWVAARLRRTMPAHAVEDALQETFIAVWRGAKATHMRKRTFRNRNWWSERRITRKRL